LKSAPGEGGVGRAADPGLAAVDDPVVLAVLAGDPSAQVIMPAGSPPASDSEMPIAEKVSPRT
jgi:hypothetical protein